MFIVQRTKANVNCANLKLANEYKTIFIRHSCDESVSEIEAIFDLFVIFAFVLSFCTFVHFLCSLT